MADLQIVADVSADRVWDGLREACRKRVAELGTTFESVDHVAGLPTRYVSKLLSPSGMKSPGLTSLGPLLGALGLRLLVVVDEEAMARIAGRLSPVKPGAPWTRNPKPTTD